MNQLTSIADQDEAGPAALFRAAWTYRITVIAVCVACGLVALVMALMAKPIYRAEVVVTEVRESGIGGGSGLVSQMGGLANLAGLGSSILGNSTSHSAQANTKL